ncbi:MAG: DUF262 domain-containing protein [Lachnospiraceae bacterium]|nr:DUF262 domain-containing protein [Lachnospiraceae bacterium]
MALVMAFSYDSRPIQTLLNQIRNLNKRDGIDLQPDYQRGYIWSTDFKDKLLYSIIKSYPIGNVSLRVRTEKNSKGAMQEVVDGQQRLTTIYKFIEGEYNIQGEIAKEIIQYIIEYMGEDFDEELVKLKKKLKNKGKVTIAYKQLPQAIKDNILAYNISITNITNATDKEITEYFRYLQNQERLRAGEILNSVPDTKLEKYLKRIVNKDRLLTKLSFQNKRMQFDRVFYSIIGLVDGQIGFGITDKEVMKFLDGCGEINTETIDKVNYLVDVLNTIAEEEAIPVNYISCNARAMKFLLLLIILELVDFRVDCKNKLKALDSINIKLSSFSSAKADSVMCAFSGYSDSVIEEYRLLALISKGGHSYKRVKNRMEILAYYVNNFDNRIQSSGIEPV